jgi:hypothetical protein
MCATDLGALKERECSYHTSSALARFRKSRSYGDFSDVTESDGAGGGDATDEPGGHRKARS